MSDDPRRPSIGEVYIRIMGRQLDRFIEFEFILNDEDLAVELVMPKSAFQEFCDYYDATILPPRIETAPDAEPRQAGLYRAPDA